MGALNEQLFTYDQAGRIQSAVFTESTEDDYVSSRVTANWSYNEHGFPSKVQRTDEDNTFLGPQNSSTTMTYEYENKKCKVAISVEPIVLATLDTVSPALVASDPVLCSYPLQLLGLNKRF